MYIRFVKTLIMKKLLYYFITLLLITSCATSHKNSVTKSKNMVKIANDSLEYEIIIMDIGFETYLNSIAKPINFYSQSFYENKNKLYVTEWNYRALNPLKYNPSIYQNRIDYNPNTNYGLEVNYKLYNYFKFVEHKYKQHFF